MALLRVPEELQAFCKTMGIPVMEVPNWYADFRHTATSRNQPNEEPMEAQVTRYCKRRSLSGNRSHAATRGSHNGSSATDSPRSRRFRRDY